MATLNLGRIKPVFKGAYDNTTAYVVDDIVTFGDESFICIQASTGNATSNTSYWTKMAAKGTDGTDLGTTLTTQGDIVYRDASGLARLGAGTSGQVLQTNGTGANPSWGTVSSDFVKISSGTISSGSGVLDIDGTSNWGSAGDYRLHKLVFSNFKTENSANVLMRMIQSGTVYTGTDYSWVVTHRNSSSTTHSNANGDADNHIRLTNDNIRGTASSETLHNFEMTIGNMITSSNNAPLEVSSIIQAPNQDGEVRMIAHIAHGITRRGGTYNSGRTGLRIYMASGTIDGGEWTIYGYKA
jgi:hypothetical protein